MRQKSWSGILFYLVLLIGLFFVNPLNASKLDSLLQRLDAHKYQDSAKVELLKSICFEYKFIDKDKALDYGTQGLMLAREIGDKLLEGNMYNLLGIVYMDYDETALALDSYLKAREVFSVINDLNGLANTSNNIGLIYYKRSSWEEALNHFHEARTYNLQLGDSLAYANNLNNIAVIYRKLEDSDKAIEYHQMAYDIHDRMKNKIGMADALQNMGIIMYGKGDYARTLDFFRRAIVQRELAGDFMGMGNLYYNMGFIYQAQEKIEEAVYHYTKSLEVAKKLKAGGLLARNLSALSDAYAQKKDFKKAYDLHLQFFAVHDSIYNLDKESRLSELQTTYETEKNSRTIELLEAENRLKTMELVRSRIILVVAFILMALFGFLFYVLQRTYVRRMKMNMLLSERNKRIFAQKNEILIQRNQMEQLNEELLSQKEEIEAQRDSLEKKSLDIQNALKTAARKKEQISASMRYASRLQLSLIPQSDHIVPGDVEFFNVYRAKEFVSGDFYWLGHLGGAFMVGILNTQLQGTPGAFLSISANNLLNSIVNENLETSPVRVLQQLNTGLYQVMHRENLLHAFSGVRFIFVKLDYRNKCAFLAGTGMVNYALVSEEFKVYQCQGAGLGLSETISEADYTECRLPLMPGDKMLIPTQGAIDWLESQLDAMKPEAFIEASLKNKETVHASFEHLLAPSDILGQDVTIIALGLKENKSQ